MSTVRKIQHRSHRKQKREDAKASLKEENKRLEKLVDELQKALHGANSEATAWRHRAGQSALQVEELEKKVKLLEHNLGSAERQAWGVLPELWPKAGAVMPLFPEVGDPVTFAGEEYRVRDVWLERGQEVKLEPYAEKFPHISRNTAEVKPDPDIDKLFAPLEPVKDEYPHNVRCPACGSDDVNPWTGDYDSYTISPRGPVGEGEPRRIRSWLCENCKEEFADPHWDGTHPDGCVCKDCSDPKAEQRQVEADEEAEMEAMEDEWPDDDDDFLDLGEDEDE